MSEGCLEDIFQGFDISRDVDYGRLLIPQKSWGWCNSELCGVALNDRSSDDRI
jgi:hypothetical protein